MPPPRNKGFSQGLWREMVKIHLNQYKASGGLNKVLDAAGDPP